MGRRAVTVRAKGLTQLHRQLEEMPEQIRAGAEAAVDEAVDAVSTDMRENVARDTNELADSIQGERDGLAGKVVAAAKHSFFVEHGTSTMPERPFGLPAAMREQKQLPKRMKQHISEELPK